VSGNDGGVMTTRAPIEPDSRDAWISAGGTALANGLAFGTTYTFGTFFGAMADEFDADKSSTALVFGLTLLLFFGFGAVSGPISDRIGGRRLLLVGTAVTALGLVLTSSVSDLRLGYFTYALVGLGGGIFIAPLTAGAGAMFERKRASALGLIAVGNGVGTLTLVPISEWLIRTQGWRSGMRFLALIGFVGCLLAWLLVRDPQRPQGSRTTQRQLRNEPGFVRVFIALVLMSISLFPAFTFIVDFAVDNGINETSAARIFALVGLSSIVGRLALTSLAGRVGALRVVQVAIGLQPVSYLLWLFAGESVGGLIAFALLLGTVYGGFVALIPEVAIVLFGTEGLGRMMGIMFLSFGVGGLIGPPVMGAIADSDGQRPAIIAIIAVAVVATMILLTVQRPAPSPR